MTAAIKNATLRCEAMLFGKQVPSFRSNVPPWFYDCGRRIWQDNNRIDIRQHLVAEYRQLSTAQNRTAGSCEHGTIRTLQLTENGATCETSLMCIRNFSIVSRYKQQNTTLWKQFVFVALYCVLFCIIGDDGKSPDTYQWYFARYDPTLKSCGT